MDMQPIKTAAARAAAASVAALGAPLLPLTAARAQQAAEAPSASYDTLGQPAAGLSGYEQLAGRPTEMLEQTQSQVDSFATALAARIYEAPFALDDLAATLRAASPDGTLTLFGHLALATILAIIISSMLMTLVYGRWLLKAWFVAKQRRAPRGYLEKLPILALRACFGAIGGVLTTLLALMMVRLYWGPIETPAEQKTVMIVATGYLLASLVALLWRMTLSPFLPRYRIPYFKDRCAKRLFYWLAATGAIAIGIESFIVWAELLGVARETIAVISPIAHLATVTLTIAMVRANHGAVSQAIIGDKPRAQATWPARAAASSWGVAVAAYVIAAWAFAASRDVMLAEPGPQLIVSTYLVVTSIIVVYGLSAFLIEWVFLPRRRRVALEGQTVDGGQTDQAGQTARGAAQTDMVAAQADSVAAPAGMVAAAAEPGFRLAHSRMVTMRDLARRVSTIFALAAGLYTLSMIWGSQSLAEAWPAIERVIDIGVTLLIAYIAYHALRIWIDQRILEEGGDMEPLEPGEGEGGGAGASRLATVLPLFRNFILTVVAISALVYVALEMGVNVAPLFAGAGIVGLALGFGAQTLVRDVLSGAFFLIDDAFRKGEYIDIGSVKGTVEKISVRSFQLRHHLGYLHTVPFGEIQHLTNYSRDWVIMKLPLRLTYDTDVDHVRKLVKNLGQELLKDPVHGEKFVQPLKSQGVIQMEDSAMIIRVKFMTRPGEQWVLRKLVYARIRELFQREGVKFAHREVTVRVADTAPQSPALAAGAAGAAALVATSGQSGVDDLADLDGPGGD